MRTILPILLLVSSIAIFILGINPFYQDVKTLKSDITTYNLALDNSTNLQKTEDTLIKAYNGIKDSDKARLNNLLPSSVNNIQFILELERVANLHNMPIKDIKFETSKTGATNTNNIVSNIVNDNRDYGVFPIEFTTEGKYDTFVSFLKDLESNLRLTDVKSISFIVPDASGKIAEGSDPNVYKYTLKVETYWLK